MKPFSAFAQTALILVTISASGLSHAAFVTGSGNIVYGGSGSSFSAGILDLGITNPNVVLTATTPSSTFAAITSPAGFAGFPKITFNQTLNLNGVVNYTGVAGPYTAQSVANLFTVGTLRFDVSGLARNVNGSGQTTSVFAQGSWVDNGGILSTTGGLLSFTTTDPAGWTNPSGTLSATGAAPSAVPLPAALPLLVFGIGALGAAARRRKAA